MLVAYRWPGNVRELVNVIERAISAAHHEQILFPKHLPIQLRIDVTQSALKREMSPPDETELVQEQNLPPLHDFRDALYSKAEKQYLHDLMALSGNDMDKACGISGLSVSRLYALLKLHGISHQR